MKSKYRQIYEALCENSSIVIVRVKEENCLPQGGGGYSHFIHFFIAPKNGIYTAEELQKCMLSLIPGLKADTVDSFYNHEDKIEFGRLWFNEDIGMESIYREITLTDEDMLSIKGFTDGKAVIKEKRTLSRRIFINLFPDYCIAKAALSGKNRYHISKDDPLYPQVVR